MERNQGAGKDRPPYSTTPDQDVGHLELREEQLRASTENRKLGEVVVRKEQDEVPGRLELEASVDEVQVEHVPIGRVVSDRDETREDEDGTVVIPVYEEQLVVSKRLVLREEIRVRRVTSKQTQLFEDTLRKERLVIEDPGGTKAVREQFSPEADEASEAPADELSTREAPSEGLVDRVVRKVIS